MSSNLLTAVGLHAPGGAFTLGVQNAGFSPIAVLGGRSNFGADTHRLNFPSIPWHAPEAAWPLAELAENAIDLVYSNPAPGESHEHACFVAGTQILTTRGPRPIESVRKGDLVMTYRSDRYQPVVATMSHVHTGPLAHVGTSMGPLFTCTPDHPICTGYVGGSDPSTFTEAQQCGGRRGWRPAQMQPGAEFTVTLQSPTGGVRVFNLTVEGDECYVAGGVLVHNCRQAHETALTLRPRAFALEGPADWFETGLKEFESRWADAGYFTARVKVNAGDFGLPQLRRRTFFMAADVGLDFRGLSAASWPAAASVTEAFSDLEGQPLETDPQLPSPYGAPHGNTFQDSSRVESTGVTWHVVSPGAPSLARLISYFEPGQHAGKISDEILALTYWKDREKTVVRGGKGRPSMYYRRLHGARPAPALPGDIRFIHPEFDRFITPREAARLMGIPDWFNFAGLSASRANLEAARTLPPRVAQVVAARLAECLTSPGNGEHVTEVDLTARSAVAV